MGKDMPKAPWKPHEKRGRLTMQSDLPDSVYVFPKQRKERLTDAQHVRNAVAQLDQVIDVDRALAFANIEKVQTTASTSRKPHGTTWALILKKNRREAAPRRCDAQTPSAELRIHWPESRPTEEVMARVRWNLNQLKPNWKEKTEHERHKRKKEPQKSGFEMKRLSVVAGKDYHTDE
jgi:hypothetical protein